MIKRSFILVASSFVGCFFLLFRCLCFISALFLFVILNFFLLLLLSRFARFSCNSNANYSPQSFPHTAQKISFINFNLFFFRSLLSARFDLCRWYCACVWLFPFVHFNVYISTFVLVHLQKPFPSTQISYKVHRSTQIYMWVLVYIHIYSLVVISLFPLSNQQKCHVPVILHTTVGNHNKWIFFHKADYSKLSNALTSSKSLKFIESLFELLLFVCLFVRSFYRSFTSQSLMHMRSLNNLKFFH